jgi:hypothetical protein
MRTETQLHDLVYDGDAFFDGCGNSSLGRASIGDVEIERRCDADGEESYVAYRRDAMSRALNRSRKAGVGALGLCADDLLESEIARFPGTATVADAIRILAAMDARRKKQ